MLHVEANADNAIRVISKTARNGRDLTPVLNRGIQRINAMIRRAFREERSPGGVDWPPPELPQRDERGRRQHVRRPQLQRTRTLARMIGLRATPYSLYLEVAVPYAEYVFRIRSPLPVWKTRYRGWKRTMRGLAGRMWRRLNREIARYIVEGR